jgi:hypothetical protein
LAALGLSNRLPAIVTDEDLDGYACQQQTTSPSRRPVKSAPALNVSRPSRRVG